MFNLLALSKAEKLKQTFCVATRLKQLISPMQFTGG
uniref:Uncharacterized protein n=1 Tax=Anguilla anguilla TaxID=7936 RepID=A0A0E9XXV7_ANGAN